MSIWETQGDSQVRPDHSAATGNWSTAGSGISAALNSMIDQIQANQLKFCPHPGTEEAAERFLGEYFVSTLCKLLDGTMVAPSLVYIPIVPELAEMFSADPDWHPSEPIPKVGFEFIPAHMVGDEEVVTRFVRAYPGPTLIGDQRLVVEQLVAEANEHAREMCHMAQGITGPDSGWERFAESIAAGYVQEVVLESVGPDPRTGYIPRQDMSSEARDREMCNTTPTETTADMPGRRHSFDQGFAGEYDLRQDNEDGDDLGKMGENADWLRDLIGGSEER